jgi:carbohydrate binding protein with CBM5/12 domain
MGYTFRTPGPWGPGISEDLTPWQVDNNFWQAIQDIKEKAVQGVGISNFVVSGNQMTVVLTDHTLLGPYPLPIAVLRFQGEWTPNTYYAANDIITHAGSTYIVQVNHTSAATFDPYANDGFGTDFYGLLLENPASTIPAGGPAGRFLRKATSADYVTEWAEAVLDDLSDVLVSAPASGQVLGYDSGGWQNVDIPQGALEGLSDVAISAAADGDLLTYVSSSAVWENKKVSLPLSGLTDVAVTTPQAGQPLVFNGIQWIDAATVDMPCGGLVSASGSVTIDRTAGEVHRLSLVGTATLVGISGWPPGGQFARLVIEMQNTGGFGFAWPGNVLWPGGVVPAATANGKDVYILISFDGGTTIYGNVVGQAFR